MIFKPKHQDVKLHRPGATVARSGRWLLVDLRVSAQSKRDRQIARDAATAILAEVGANESAFSIIADVVSNENLEQS